MTTLFMVVGCAKAKSPVIQLRTECVGRAQVDIPADSEFAVTSMKKWGHDQGFVDPIRFGDDTRAAFSSFYYMGGIDITDIISDAEFSMIRAKTAEIADENRKYFRSHGKPALGDAIHLMATNSANIFGQEYEKTAEIFTRIGGRAIGFKTSQFPTLLENEKLAQTFSKEYRSRMAFELPRDEGICFPYGFLPGAEIGGDDISVTTRSKIYPDFTINFQSNMHVLVDVNRNGLELAKDFLLPELLVGFSKMKSYTIEPRNILRMEGAVVFVRGLNKLGIESRAFGAIMVGNDSAAGGVRNIVLRIFESPVESASRLKFSEHEFKSLSGKIVDSIGIRAGHK